MLCVQSEQIEGNETMLAIIFLWLPLCIAVGILAERYNRSGIGWFLLSVCFSPLVGAAFVLALGPLASVTHQTGGLAPARNVDHQRVVRDRDFEDTTTGKLVFTAVILTVLIGLPTLIHFTKKDKPITTQSYAVPHEPISSAAIITGPVGVVPSDPAKVAAERKALQARRACLSDPKLTDKQKAARCTQ
jgi:hypothetical protein